MYPELSTEPTQRKREWLIYIKEIDVDANSEHRPQGAVTGYTGSITNEFRAAIWVAGCRIVPWLRSRTAGDQEQKMKRRYEAAANQIL